MHVLGKMNQGADMLSRNNVSSEEWTLHPFAVQRILEVFGRARVDLFASEDNSHCPIFFTRCTDALAHEWPSPALYAFPPSHSATAGTQASRKQRFKMILIAPLWRNQPWVFELFQLLKAAPWPIPLRRDLLSQANGTIWHPWPELWALHLWLLNGSLFLPERVLNTMAEARAPSTRRLYSLKWSIFSARCQDRDLDPVTSDVSVFLSLLQKMLDKQRSSSTIKVYAAAIAAFHASIAGRSVDRDNSIFTRPQENESPASSYSSTLGLTNRTKGPCLNHCNPRACGITNCI